MSRRISRGIAAAVAVFAGTACFSLYDAEQSPAEAAGCSCPAGFTVFNSGPTPQCISTSGPPFTVQACGSGNNASQVSRQKIEAAKMLSIPVAPPGNVSNDGTDDPDPTTRFMDWYYRQLQILNGQLQNTNIGVIAGGVGDV
jgi:hypothetical protein